MRKAICWMAVVAVVALLGGPAAAADPVTLKVGHVGHDHHLALFVAADNSDQYARETGIALRPVKDRKFYELVDGDRKLADVEIVTVGGGSKMPTALAQGIIEVGLGGTAAVLAAADKGAPVKLIAPLHHKGDMFVVRPDFPAKTWDQFVALAKEADKPIRIGYKDPVAVAKVIFEEALKHEGIAFGGDLSRRDVKVHMINVKGGGKLNVALGQGLVDGYVGNNPFPAIGLEKGILRVVCDLEDLPPGGFRNHPCCCVGAHARALEEKPEAIVALLVLLVQATETINADLDAAVASAMKWIGTSEAVQRMSIPTSAYIMDPTPEWHGYMVTWLAAMNGLGVFQGHLAGLTEPQVAKVAYDLSFLENAKERLARARAK